MKKICVLVALCLVPSTVHGADLFGSFPIGISNGSSMQRWMGCSLGANLGVGWQNSDDSFDAGNYSINSASGVIGGGQIGCDYQVNNWVLGLQGMFDGASMNESRTLELGLFNPEILNPEAKWFATLTGRIGYSLSPNLLAYVKGGAAWVHNNYTVSGVYNGNDPFSVQGDGTASGWTVGGGLEKALDAKWSIYAEYNYMDFSSLNISYSGNYPSCAGDCGPWTDKWDHSIHSLIFGLNYHFY